MITEASRGIGLGHLIRSAVAGFALKVGLNAKVQLIIKGDNIEHSILTRLKSQWTPNFNISQEFFESADIVVVDVRRIDQDVRLLLKEKPALRVGIDVDLDDAHLFDLIWMPCLHIPKDKICLYGPDMRFGAECFLLPQQLNFNHGPVVAEDCLNVLVMTGGSDPLELSNSLPEFLEASLDSSIQITWVQGPYALSPNMKYCENKHRWTVLEAPDDLPSRIPTFHAALCVFGVSYFECLQANVPTIVFDPIQAATGEEWELLRSLMPDRVASGAFDAVERLSRLLADGPDYPETAVDFSRQLAVGPKRFADFVSQRWRTFQANSNV